MEFEALENPNVDAMGAGIATAQFIVSNRGPGTEGKRGFGLGLAGVKTILEAHGGRVQVHSEPDKGSVFTVFLPKTGESELTSIQKRKSFEDISDAR